MAALARIACAVFAISTAVVTEDVDVDSLEQTPLLACPGGLPGGLPQDFFEELDTWQKKYSRDNLKVSRDFLYSVYELKVLPHFRSSVEQCPAAVLEIMMNAVLAADTDYSMESAQALYMNAIEIAHSMTDNVAVAELLDNWADDTVNVYPFLFGMQHRRHCYNTSVKIYVYEVPDGLTKPLLHCAIGQWATEVLFHRFLLTAPCRTMDPNEADFFFVPIYGTCLFVREQVDSDTRAHQVLWDPLIDFLFQQASFRRRHGLDHIFLFADGQSARIWDSYDLVRSNAIFMMVESKCPTWDEPLSHYTDVKSCSSAWKDVIIPGHTDYARLRYMLKQNKRSEERDILMTFHGRHPGSHEAYHNCAVRGRIMELANYDAVDVGGFVPDYLERKGKSHFCLVPGGTSPWTNQLYESIFCGCIPVILSDEYDVAFHSRLDWPSFSIKWPEEAVDARLYDFLRSFPPDRLQRMKSSLDRHRCWFNYYSEDEDCSPFLAVLEALEHRKKNFPRLHGRFWNSAKEFESSTSTGIGQRRITRFHAHRNQSFQLPW